MKKLIVSLFVLMTSIMLISSLPAQENPDSRTGTLTGHIAIERVGPMMGGTVFFFNEASGPPPSATKYWRIPTEVFSVDDDAHFVAVLPEGTYYMGAIERISGDLLGPPQEGDYFFISQDAKGRPKKYTVEKNTIVDLGVIAGAKPFKRATLAKKGVTSIRGTIRDDKKVSAEGMLVFAYTTPMMIGRPMFVSDRSDKTGRYLLRVAGGGKYYLRARVNYGGGPPAADEVMGVYKDGKPVTVKTGKMRSGADITVYKVGMTEKDR